jgi:uncharacterized caspase-like protein
MANNWAIVVGVNHYEHHPERKLRYAVRDADRLGDFLEQSAQFEGSNVIRCLGEETRRGEANYPSCSNLIRVLNRDLKPNNIGQAQHLWFFFSGHGISRNGRDFLVPSDCLEEDRDRFLLPVDEVIAALRLHQKAEIVLILDACREKIGSKGNDPSIGAQTVEFAKERGVTTIFSCGYGQLSYELEALQQGAFTHALVEGLGQFTLPFQLEPFLQRRVDELHREAQKSVTQTPKIQTDSTAKVFQSLLPECVTASDVTFLIEQAKQAELEEEFDDAKRWLRQVIEAAPLPSQRREALNALDRIERKMARQRSIPDLEAAYQQFNINLEPGSKYIAPPVSLAAEKIQYNINLKEGSTFVASPQDNIDTVPFGSEHKINYRKLRDLLKEGKWEEADQATYDLMYEVLDTKSIKVKHLKAYPLEAIEETDRIWAEFSSGQFGFKIQAQIWQQCDRDENKFELQVGWRDEGQNKQKPYKKLIFDPSMAKQGHLPAFFKSWGGGGWSWMAYLLDRVSEGIIPSPVDNVPLESEKGVDYRKLRDLLREGKWEDADRETLEVMLKATDCQKWLNNFAWKNLPCQDLRTIDQLWVTASQGHFGFSIQKRIWEKCGSPTSKISASSWKSFILQLGWRNTSATMDYAALGKALSGKFSTGL